MFVIALACGLLVPWLAYGSFHVMTVVGVTVATWVILSSLYEPLQRLRAGQSLSRGVLGMTVAHLGVGLFALGVAVTQSYRIERDIALSPGGQAEVKGYEFRFVGTREVSGPNFEAIESEVVVTRGGELVATLHPQKRVYRVQKSPMTEAGIDAAWNRDLFVAMGEDLGNGAWSMRLQYKPLVRFIWFGALVMAIGGLIALTDRRYRTSRAAAAEGPLPGTAQPG
jgi:cytochrome c-type biogenesis protein CcmF